MSKYWHGDPIRVIGLNYHQSQPTDTALCQVIINADLVISTILQADLSPTLFHEGQRFVYISEQTRESDFPWELLRLFFDQRVIVLTYGDPLFYGIASAMRKRLPQGELVVYPSVSLIQRAFARIGQPWEKAQIIDLSDKPLSSLRALLANNTTYALMINADITPIAVATELCALDLAASSVWVFEGGIRDEQIIFDYADALSRTEELFNQPNLMIVNTQGQGTTLCHGFGIDDQLFLYPNDKALHFSQHVRVNILSFLLTRPNEIGWVVGAGFGEVAIEWARHCPFSRIHAIDNQLNCGEYINSNKEKFGVYNLIVHVAAAPPILDDIEAPDAVLITIDGSDPRFEVILDVAWERLRPGGKLIVAARTETTKFKLYQYAAKLKQWAEMEAIAVNIGYWQETQYRANLMHTPPLFIAKWHKMWA